MEKIIGLIDAPFTPFHENGDLNLEDPSSIATINSFVIRFISLSIQIRYNIFFQAPLDEHLMVEPPSFYR